jgi:hypothetical protein
MDPNKWMYDDVNVTVIDCKLSILTELMILLHLKKYNLNNDFSIEVWVKPNSCNTSTVFQEKCANNTTGYDGIVNGQVKKFNWYSNGSGSGSVT